MPPRYAYWTILLGTEPTSFRAGSQEELLPTFNRIKAKDPSAVMMWWQNGKLWISRLEAQEAMRARGERGRQGDFRQRDVLSERRSGGRPEGRGSKGDRGLPSSRPPREERNASGKFDWKPKGAFTPKPSAKPEWKPKGSFTPQRPAKPAWQSKSRDDRPRRGEKPAWKPKGAGVADRSKLEWRPKGDAPAAEGRGRTQAPRPRTQDSRPKTQDRSRKGDDQRRDRTWRPGGDHRDPRQKYKDAKKAKWGRFKQAIRKRWESKQGGKPPRPKKKDDD